ncbi:MAG: phospholipid/cholesterol/gamma-HCH transport system substrate-binding protein [Solirubrobacterales bacterium]|jgi:virulence factor Mce-like protein|nr:phospholipid/cholesterol/gamma-HCH transport system substrate-binding protein [Solirubrobacterales bacterium]
MGQRAPTMGQIAVAVAFAFSCFGLLLFLWTTFGGPVPLKPEGYRVNVPFSEATQLAQESDVRIHGVSVGKVKSINLANSGPNRDLAVASIEIDTPYAPIPADTRATLRQKTLLGETYVELTQGNKNGPKLPEGGTLPKAQVEPSVQLDEIFRTFDAKTRASFQTWMQQLAIASAGRGADLSAAIANLAPFAEDANKVLRVLDTQQGAVQQLVRNTGEVFGALSERQGQLQGLIRNSGTVFATTARRNQDLEATFRALPTFLDESTLTLNRLQSFARNANPVITQLHPAARALSADLKPIAKVAPDFKGFFVGFRKTAKRAESGLPALQQLLNGDLPPLLTQLHPFTQQLTPLVAEIGRYKSDITGFLGNVTSTTQAVANTETNTTTHYIRSSAPLYPEGLAAFTSHRLAYSRTNPYIAPDSALKIIGGLDTFDTRACASPPGQVVGFGPDSLYTSSPFFSNRATFDTPQQILDELKQFPFTGQNTSAGLPAPACTKQAQQPSLGQVSESSDYTHVYANP